MPSYVLSGDHVLVARVLVPWMRLMVRARMASPGRSYSAEPGYCAAECPEGALAAGTKGEGGLQEIVSACANYQLQRCNHSYSQLLALDLRLDGAVRGRPTPFALPPPAPPLSPPLPFPFGPASPAFNGCRCSNNFLLYLLAMFTVRLPNGSSGRSLLRPTERQCVTHEGWKRGKSR